MESIETITYKGQEIKIFYDEDSNSPDEWGNTDLFIVYDHRQFSIERKGFVPSEIFEFLQQTKGKKLFCGYYIFPLYAYIHSGVSLSLGNNSYPFTCGWDTSMTGFVLVKKEKGAYTPKKAQKAAGYIVEEWNQYLSGDVYGYNSDSGSCCGFYGSEGKKHMIEEAKNEIDYDLNKKVKSHFDRLKIWIKNNVPLTKRQPLNIIEL